MSWGPRKAQFGALLAAATAAEQAFLAALVLGELRQGALDALVAEAVALATGHAPAAVQLHKDGDEVRMYSRALSHRVLRARARPRPRGRDGQGARRALQRRQPRRRLAQDQARPPARSGRARRRVGLRPAPGLLSNLHLGARDPATGGFVMLGKTFKGMTDEVLARQTTALSAIAVDRAGPIVHVRPELVVEIAFNDVLRSSRYPGGVALRFARLVRYRDDKTAAQADTLHAVRAIAVAAGVALTA